MGYFSELAAAQFFCAEDSSYPLPEQQLLWRLEDLENRLEELAERQRVYEDRVCFSEDDLRHVLPEHFMTAADAAAAIELVTRDLQERYGISVGAAEEDGIDEVTDLQLSFRDLSCVAA